MGTSRLVGLRHNAHCLSFKLDLYMRFIVKYAAGEQGEEMLRACDAAFNESNVQEALLNYCAGESGELYGHLLSELERFNAKDGIYATSGRRSTR